MEEKKYILPPLTPELMDFLIFAMENNEETLLDLEESTVVYGSETDRKVLKATPERFLETPAWSSARGYELMLDFVSNLPSDKSELREQLVKILNSRKKGVFRRFKDTLSADKNLLESWYEFKDNRMARVIQSWYLDLEDSSGLDDEITELMFEDITFAEQSGVPEEIQRKFDKHVPNNSILRDLWKAYENKNTLTAKNPDDEIIGTVVYSYVGKQICVLYYWVDSTLREMGIFSALTETLRGKKSSRIVFPLFEKNNFLMPFFEKKGCAQDTNFISLKPKNDKKVAKTDENILFL